MQEKSFRRVYDAHWEIHELSKTLGQKNLVCKPFCTEYKHFCKCRRELRLKFCPLFVMCAFFRVDCSVCRRPSKFIVKILRSHDNSIALQLNCVQPSCRKRLATSIQINAEKQRISISSIFVIKNSQFSARRSQIWNLFGILVKIRVCGEGLGLYRIAS